MNGSPAESSECRSAKSAESPDENLKTANPVRVPQIDLSQIPSDSVPLIMAQASQFLQGLNEEVKESMDILVAENQRLHAKIERMKADPMLKRVQSWCSEAKDHDGDYGLAARHVCGMVGVEVK